MKQASHNKTSFHKLLGLLACLSFVFLLVLQSEGKTAPRQTHVNAVTLSTNFFNLDQKAIFALIPIKKGDIYTDEKLANAIETLKRTALFKSVEASSQRTRGGVTIRFDLSQASIVRQISIHGNYPYLEKKILRLSLLQAGDAFNQDLADQTKTRIENFFRTEGYSESKIVITVSEEKDRPFTNIKISIHKRGTKPLGKITFAGNTVFKESYLRNKIRGFGYYRYSTTKNRIKKLETKYLKRGYVRSRVRLQSATPTDDRKKIDLDINVEERKKLVLRFEGNSFFRDSTLKDQVTFFRDRGYDRYSLEESIHNLTDFYRFNGFLSATVDGDIDTSDKEVTITFNINEGIRTRLKKIELTGLNKLSEGDVTKYFKNEEHSVYAQGFFKEDLVDPDIKSIDHVFEDKGFFDAKVVDYSTEFNFFGDNVDLKINLDEGTRYTIGNVIFDGNKAFTNRMLAKKSDLKTGKNYERKNILSAQDKITNLYHQAGYPYTKVEISETASVDHQRDIHFTISDGPLAEIDNIVVSGQYLTKERVILNALNFKKGDKYTYKKILDAQLALKRLGIFDYVRLIPMGIDEERSKIDIIIKVQERKSVTMDIQGGYDTDTQLSGQLLLTKRNIFGSGRQLQARLIGGQELNRGELTLYTPRIFNATWNLVKQGFFQYEDRENFNAESFGGSVGVFKYFGLNFSLLMRAQISRFNIFENKSNQTALLDNLYDNTFGEFLVSATYDNRDNYSDPQHGFYALASTEFNNDLANPSNQFNITKVNLAHYVKLPLRLNLINNFRIGQLTRIQEAAQIPVQKLFFMGGNDTVRGFKEDAIDTSGGTTSIIYNAELHYRIFDNLKIAGFFDMGSLTNSLNSITFDNFRESAGVGLRYVTPVGPIRLDYGFVLDKKVGEAGKRLHFSFGYFF